MVTRSLVIPLPPREGGAERQTEQVLLKRQNWSTFASSSGRGEKFRMTNLDS